MRHLLASNLICLALPPFYRDFWKEVPIPQATSYRVIQK